MDELNTLPAGWAWHDIAKNGSFAARDKGKLMFSIEGPVWVAIPVTAEAVAEQMSEYKTKYVGKDGETIGLTGADAVGLRTYLHSFESFRGLLRTESQTGELAEDDIRARVMAWRYGQKTKRAPITASKTALEAAIAAGTVEEYLLSIGAVVKDD